MIPNLLDFCKLMTENNISIVYNGPIWGEGVEGIGQTLRKRLEIDELSLNTSQSVFSVFVEQMQNILNYSADKEVYMNGNTGKEFPVASGIFIMGVKDKRYFIQCGNKTRNNQVDFIKEKIDHLNTLDKTGLRKYYKECLKSENTNPESLGAGLGLIEIARRASSRIEYNFTPMEEGYSFFSMYVQVE